MARLSELKVGDKITVNMSSSDPYVFRTVKDVRKNAIIDNTGQKWTMNVSRWGYSGRWCDQTVQPYKPEHEQWNKDHIKEVTLRRKQNKLSGYRWRDAPEEIVNAAYAVIERDTQ